MPIRRAGGNDGQHGPHQPECGAEINSRTVADNAMTANRLEQLTAGLEAEIGRFRAA